MKTFNIVNAHFKSESQMKFLQQIAFLLFILIISSTPAQEKKIISLDLRTKKYG
ncbi:MAG: hypothetical protein P8X73_05845 [Ignavibacteriaceae bacterium]